ncbi:MAG: hypothetical protein RL030_1356, partial [Pseudomonadota bacterium]
FSQQALAALAVQALALFDGGSPYTVLALCLAAVASAMLIETRSGRSGTLARP